MVGPVTVNRQDQPKIAKNGKQFCFVVLKSAGSEMRLSMWDGAAKWRLPLATEITLRGKFIKEEWDGKPSLKCDELTPPEGATEFAPEEVRGEESKPTIKACLDAGLRAADYMAKKSQPSLSEAAFIFAANAALQGVKPE